MAKPTLYGFAECHESARVRRLLRQCGVPFDAVMLPAGDKSLVRAKFGVDSVPVLVHGPYRSADAAGIVAYAQATFDAGATTVAQARRGRA